MHTINSLSIVLPCYNEEKNIPLILDRFQEAIAQAHPSIPFEILLVDNGSTDNSRRVMDEELHRRQVDCFKIVTVEKNIGYGFGILSGLRAASGDVLAWTHADMQTDPLDVFKAFEYYQAIFNRQQGDFRFIIKGNRVNRRFGEWFFTLGMSILSSLVLTKFLFDINAQPKVFHRGLFNTLKNPPNDFSLDLYLLYKAKLNRYPVKTIDVVFSERIHGESHWASSFKSKYKTIMRTIKYIFALRGHVKHESA
jgi:glycosyltransferase involved in cell wall biosynthesis